jgi:flagellar basal body-associated protein FliL
MSKLAALTEKLGQTRTKITDKLFSLGPLKKWREARAAQASSATGAKAGPHPGLVEIYRQGGTGTRLQVLLVYLFMIAAIGFTGYAGLKMFVRFESEAHEELKQDYASGFEEINRRVVENANVLSLGEFTAQAFVRGRTVFVKLDIWIKTSDPQAAEFAQKQDVILHDRVVDALDVLYRAQVDIMTEAGNATAKQRILESLNQAMPKGKVEEIFFHNLLMQ